MSEPKALTREEASKIVGVIAKGCWDFLGTQLKEVNEEQRFLIHGRILNLLVKWTFAPIFREFEEEERR